MYSIFWARNTVKALYREHARASYLLLVSTGTTMDLWAKILAKSDNDRILSQAWNLLKVFLRLLTDNLDQRIPRDTTRVFSKLSRSILSEVFWTFDEKHAGPEWTGWEYLVQNGFAVLKGAPTARSHKKKDRAEHGPFLPGFEEVS